MAEPATSMDTSSQSSSNQHSSSSQNELIIPESLSSEVEVQDSSEIAEPVKIVSDEDQKTLQAVLQFLQKNNLSKTVDALKNETEKAGGKCSSFLFFFHIYSFVLSEMCRC